MNRNFADGLLEMKEVETAARALSLEVDTIEIRKAEEIAPVFAMLKDRAGALYVVGDPLIFTNRVRISTLAAGARVPTMYNFREYVEAGGLMSYGPNFPVYSGALPTTSTRFCVGRNRPIFRSSSRPSSISSLTLRPRRLSVLKFPRHCSPAPTR